VRLGRARGPAGVPRGCAGECARIAAQDVLPLQKVERCVVEPGSNGTRGIDAVGRGRRRAGRVGRGGGAAAYRARRQPGRGGPNGGQAAPAAGTGVSRALQNAPWRHADSACRAGYTRCGCSAHLRAAAPAWPCTRLHTGPSAGA